MSLKRNTLYNLIGAIAPITVSILIVPAYLHKIGEDRYGVLTIVWLFLGYFGAFDFGLSRATANIFARLRAAPREEREEVFWTALSLNAVFGALGGATVYVTGSFVMSHYFKIPDALRPEAISAMPWLAATIPLSIVNGVLGGVLEGGERFLALNLINFLGNIVFQVIPLGIAYFWSPSLAVLMPAAILSRLFSTVLPTSILLVREVPIRGRLKFSKAWAKELFSYGGWVSVNGIISPIFASLDRFVIGSTLGTADVAVYTVPYNLVHRFQVLPGAISRSLFPRFSGLPPMEASRLGGEATAALATLTVPFFLIAIFAIRPFLSVWIDPGFAQKASVVGEILAYGVWANAMAFIAFSLLQGQGNVRVVAMIHVYEAPFVILMMWGGAHFFGLAGASWASTTRNAVDSVIFLVQAGLWSTVQRRLMVSSLWLFAGLASVEFVAPPLQWVIGAAMIIASSFWVWRTERHLVDRLVVLPWLRKTVSV